MTTATEDKLMEFLAALFKVPRESLGDSQTMQDIELWDSLKHMQLVVGLETGFNIQFSAEDISNMKCIGDIKRILLNKAR